MRGLQIIFEGETTTASLLERIVGSPPNTPWRLTKDLGDISLGLRTPFLLRSSDPSLVSQIKYLKLTGQPYIYYVDDNFWLIDDSSPLGSYYSNPSIRRSLAHIVSGASLVICHTKVFSDFLKRFNQNVAILPAFFDFEIIPFSRAKPVHPDERRIGIVSNKSKEADVKFACDAALSALKVYQGNAVLEVIGFLPKEYVGNPRVRHFSGDKNYDSFLQLQFSRGWDIGLAPLLASKFSNYKTNNKYREYGGCEVAGIYSDCDLYRHSVEHCKTGWLVNNIHSEWKFAILEILGNLDSSKSVGQAARIDAKNSFDITSVKTQWRDALDPYIKPLRVAAGRISKSFRSRFFKKLNDGLPFLISKSTPSQTPNLDLAYSHNHIVFVLHPGEQLTSSHSETYEGLFTFTGIFATFGEITKGRVEIVTQASSYEGQESKCELFDVDDGFEAKLSIKTNMGCDITFNVRNNTDKTIGLYLMAPNGRTKFEGSDHCHQGLVFS